MKIYSNLEQTENKSYVNQTLCPFFFAAENLQKLEVLDKHNPPGIMRGFGTHDDRLRDETY